jgi:hypothetical protein
MSKKRSVANGKDKSRPPKPLFSAEEKKILDSILDQDPPVIELSISVLNVDLSYQDRPRDRIVNLVTTNFSQALLGIFSIGQRPDGSYWVCDGASRLQGLLNRGEKTRMVKCQVFQTTGPQQEALLFAYLNSRRSKEPTKLITNMQAYNVAGTDKGFGKAIAECGFTLTKGKCQLRGPVYVRMAWDLDGEGIAMRKALFSVKDCWRDKYKVPGYLIFGIALLYHSQARPIDDQVRRILSKNAPVDIMDAIAKRYMKAGGPVRLHPHDQAKLTAHVLADMINKNPGKSGRIDIGRLNRAEDEARI